jgi:hypothetical protein
VGPRSGLDAVTKRKILSPWRKLDPDRPVCNLVAVPTELHRLQSFLYDSDDGVLVLNELCLWTLSIVWRLKNEKLKKKKN